MEFTIQNYISEHSKIFAKMDKDAIQRCLDLMEETINNGKKILTCGNGGSASTASHYITDWNKMYNLATGKKFRGISLVDNMGLITAYGNDISYEEVFAGQVKTLMEDGDLLVVVSGSGNSPNIISAINAAKACNGKVLGCLGYDGGKAIKLCNEVFHTPSWDMQICEDIHLSFGHLVMKTICKNNIDPCIDR